ncbi:MAG: hypothetical protein Kow0096_10160 [Thiohalomonadaceae bacterium]
MRYLIPLLCILCGNAVAADAPRHGFWGAINVGIGRVNLEPQVAAERDAMPLNLPQTTSDRRSVCLAGFPPSPNNPQATSSSHIMRAVTYACIHADHA